MNNTAAILLTCLGICFIAYSSWAYYQRRCEAKRQAMLREEDAQRCYERARSAFSPALVQPEGTAAASFDVTLGEEQVKLLRDTIVIGDDADDLAPIRMVVGDGHSGHGLYLAQVEYQDEGAVLLAAMPKPPAYGSAQAPALAPTQAAQDVLAERQRQVEREGYTLQHDADMHDSNDLARAAAFYAMAEVGYEYGRVSWPWDEDVCKVKDRYRNFVRAAALLIAAADVERARSHVSDVPVQGSQS